jgi:hypothetical protein
MFNWTSVGLAASPIEAIYYLLCYVGSVMSDIVRKPGKQKSDLYDCQCKVEYTGSSTTHGPRRSLFLPLCKFRQGY